MESELRSHVTTFDAWHVFVGVRISDLNNKWLNSIIVKMTIRVDDHFSKYKSMISIPSHLSRPPLSCCYGWGLNDKLICFFVKRSCSLKTSYVRAVTQFCLSIAANDVHIVAFGKPFFQLFSSRKAIN